MNTYKYAWDRLRKAVEDYDATFAPFSTPDAADRWTGSVVETRAYQEGLRAANVEKKLLVLMDSLLYAALIAQEDMTSCEFVSSEIS